VVAMLLELLGQPLLGLHCQVPPSRSVNQMTEHTGPI
jgi:hypothetical protein